jgi:enolase
MANLIEMVDAYEVLDSRGQPTLRVRVALQDGSAGVATAPSGASTGSHEVAERRDGDKKRYRGKGVKEASDLVRRDISHALRGERANSQTRIDQLLLDFFGTDRRGELGSNVMCAISMAVARAAAAQQGCTLYSYLGGIDATRLPVPMMNVINGGLHANNALDFQEFMIVPHGAPTLAEAVRYGAETFQALKDILNQAQQSTAVGDEGGFAPDVKEANEACDLIVQAIERAGYRPGEDIAIALDPAASSFYEDGLYKLGSHGGVEGSVLGQMYASMIGRYPIVSIEDGFAEDDWSAFTAQTEAIGDKIQIVGDDLYTTNAERIRRGVASKATNAVLIKINQIGTLTETMKAIQVCRDAGWRYIISHRSGETEDTFIADFAVGTGAGQIKTGSLSRSERLAKYNRLIEIERELGDSAVYRSPFRSA